MMTLTFFLYWLMIPGGFFVVLLGVTDRFNDIMASPPTKRTRVKRLILEISGAIIFLFGCILLVAYACKHEL